MLEEELKKVFLLPTETELIVQYRDDEGDNITMGSDRELIEAVQFASSGCTLYRSRDKFTRSFDGSCADITSIF